MYRLIRTSAVPTTIRVSVQSSPSSTFTSRRSPALLRGAQYLASATTTSVSTAIHSSCQKPCRAYSAGVIPVRRMIEP